MIVIGISGRAGHGKDTIADHLTARYGFVRRSFADPLREAAASIFGFTSAQMLDRVRKEQVDPRWGLSPRQVLQTLGTECMRAHFAADVWIRSFDMWLETLPADTPGVVVPDVRFVNEADAIRARGFLGEVWRVYRPGAQSHVNHHISEIALDGYRDFSRFVDNNATLDDLRSRIDMIALSLRLRDKNEAPSL